MGIEATNAVYEGNDLNFIREYVISLKIFQKMYSAPNN